jgi:hypothetical protein
LQRLELGEFEAALDRFGADLARWPEPDRQAAQELMERSEAARQLHAAMLAVEAGLRAPPPAAPKGLADRIVARALKLPPDKDRG